MASSPVKVVEDLSSATATTDYLEIRHGNLPKEAPIGCEYSLKGTFSATVVLERKKPNESWADAKTWRTYTGAVEDTYEAYGDWDLRWRVSSYSSGTVETGLWN